MFSVLTLAVMLADSSQCDAIAKLAHERVKDSFFDEQPRTGATHMTLIEEDAANDPFNGLIERRIRKDNVGRFATELERELLAAAGNGALDRLTDRSRAREGHLVDAFVLDQRGSGRTCAGDDVDHPGRKVVLLHDIGEQQCRQRRGLGRL